MTTTRPRSAGSPAWTAISIALLTLAGCPDDSGPGGDAHTAGDADAVSPDAAPTGRAFLLGGRAEAYDFTAPAPVRPWVPSAETLGSDDLAEVIVIPLDLLGVPWDSFTGPDNQPTDLPGPWVAAVNALKALAEATDRPIALALTPLAPGFDTLATDAREQSGVLVLNPSRHPPCYNPAADGNPTKWRDAFAGYAAWAVRQFQPRWVILGQRLNRYEANCGVAPYTALLDYPAEAHRRVKALLNVTVPTTIVGVDVEDLYGYPQKPGRCVATTPEACFATRSPLLDGIEGDLLGLESYPAFALDALPSLPSDWLTRVADARPDLGGAIIGTHLPAVSLSRRGAVCTPLIESSEAAQTAWLDTVINAATTRRMQLVIWRSLRDLLPAAVVSSCPCSGDVDVCQHLGTLPAADDLRRMVAAGLVTVDGVERAATTIWRQTLLID